MPPRRSREQLIIILADLEAAVWREELDSSEFTPQKAQDLYRKYQRYSTPKLQEMAAGVAPRSVGRPKSWWRRNDGSRYTRLFPKVDKAQSSGKRSERGALKFVAEKAGVSEKTLRTKYREWKRSRAVLRI